MKLRDSLTENNSILLQADATSWQEAVRLGVDLLVRADVVEPRYYQSILDGVVQHGPYFVIAPGLAMPHGRPEEGVKKTGFSLVTLKTPLIFNHEDNDPVDILITMAAVDAATHQEVGIMQIVSLFEDDANFDRLRACRTEQDVLYLIDHATQAEPTGESNMPLPMLQVALDNQTLSDAYETTRLIAEEVDIIEVGTILCVGEGVRAVRDLKALYPHKIVLADAKIADAGKILSRMCFEANADWVTVICCADINTAGGALEVAKEYGGDVQIELTGHWTWAQAQAWHDAGIQQVVYHRSRDAQAAGVAWGDQDILAIQRLNDMGFKVTVTGGLALEDLPMFKAIPIHVFIAGRSIRDAVSPVEAARQFKRSIAEIWG